MAAREEAQRQREADLAATVEKEAQRQREADIAAREAQRQREADVAAREEVQKQCDAYDIARAHELVVIRRHGERQPNHANRIATKELELASFDE